MKDMSDLQHIDHNPIFEVITSANPQPDLLKLVRALVQNNSDLKEVFKKARESKSSVDEGTLFEKLKSRLSVGDVDLKEVVSYLSAEYSQCAENDVVILFSTSTGKAVARITEKEIYTPKPVPREGGGMASRLPEIRPEVKAYILSHIYETENDQRVLALLQERSVQTELLKLEGDPKLLPYSRDGRRKFEKALENLLPEVLKESTWSPKGVAKKFLDLLTVVTHKLDLPKDGKYKPMEVHLEGRFKRNLLDQTAGNLKFGGIEPAMLSIFTDWVRNLGSEMLENSNAPRKVAMADLLGMADQDLFVAQPDVAVGIPFDTLAVFTYGTANCLALQGPIGYLEVLPETTQVKSSEVHDKWTVFGTVKATLWVDWSKVRVLSVTDAPVTGVHVDVI